MYTCQLTSQHPKPIRLLQIADCHLFTDKTKSLLGMNTFDSFQAVISSIDNQNLVFDYLLMTGDLSQDQSIESYQHIIDSIAHWSLPEFWLPGNHDHRDNMRHAMEMAGIKYYNRVLLGDNWQIIILDSQEKGKPHGMLSQTQLELLEKALTIEPERFTLITLHHHPVLAGSDWLDQHSLHNNDAFWQVLASFPKVKGVVCGHIHQDLDLIYQDCRVMAAPSTCIQFLPNSKEFALDAKAPGWREIELHQDGKLTTSVGRIDESLFSPDMTSIGY